MTESPPVKRAPPKSARRRARELALQGLYQWLVAQQEPGVIDAHMREHDGFERCDREHFDALLHGCIAEAADIDALLARHVDRKTTELSPVEHGVQCRGLFDAAVQQGVEVGAVALGEAVHVADVRFHRGRLLARQQPLVQALQRQFARAAACRFRGRAFGGRGFGHWSTLRAARGPAKRE